MENNANELNAIDLIDLICDNEFDKVEEIVNRLCSNRSLDSIHKMLKSYKNDLEEVIVTIKDLLNTPCIHYQLDKDTAQKITDAAAYMINCIDTRLLYFEQAVSLGDEITSSVKNVCLSMYSEMFVRYIRLMIATVSFMNNSSNEIAYNSLDAFKATLAQ